MGAARERDQADFDLDRFINMFDEAMTSRDPRVIDALRSLMMMVVLTRPETSGPAADRQSGPLRQLYNDVYNLNRRLSRTEEELRALKQETMKYRDSSNYRYDYPYEKYTMTTASESTASQFDQDVLNRLMAASQIKGLTKK